MDKILREILQVGRALFEEGLVDAVSGNLSVKFREHIYITRRGRITGNLRRGDILRVKLNNDFLDPRASSELIVHREIYKTTDAGAVVHAHPVSAVALSLHLEEIRPIDSEGRDILGNVKVISVSKPSASRELALAVSDVLKGNSIVLVRGHGAFCRARKLKEAYRLVSCLEHSCKILILQKRNGR
jgi:L-fuculose-phosphate aldolase